MTEKEMKKLRRADLLEMLLGQMEENRKLKKKIKQMEKELSDRSIAVEESGSIAEAALRLNRVFEAAQQAADQENVPGLAGTGDAGRRTCKSRQTQPVRTGAGFPPLLTCRLLR